MGQIRIDLKPDTLALERGLRSISSSAEIRTHTKSYENLPKEVGLPLVLKEVKRRLESNYIEDIKIGVELISYFELSPKEVERAGVDASKLAETLRLHISKAETVLEIRKALELAVKVLESEISISRHELIPDILDSINRSLPQIRDSVHANWIVRPVISLKLQRDEMNGSIDKDGAKRLIEIFSKNRDAEEIESAAQALGIGKNNGRSLLASFKRF